MNLNKLLTTLLSKTRLPVSQDEYDGCCDKYIIYTYEDERPADYADNRVIADTTYLQIQLITPKNFNYITLKKEIRDILECADFSVRSIKSFLGSGHVGTEKVRQTIFHVEYTTGRR